MQGRGYLPYLPGSILEVEEALNWCKAIVGDSFPQHTSEIDDSFLCHELESILRETKLNQIRQQVIEIFSDIIAGYLIAPQEIWKRLTTFEIDYNAAIGMESYIDRWGTTSHRDFSRWHEINLSPTGHWLIEFRSSVDPTITFHTPYDKQKIISPANLSSLPLIRVEQAKFGREISNFEQQQYPLSKLLEILDCSVNDFPYNLDKYERQRNYSREWSEEESWEGDEDEFYEIC